MFKSKPCAVCAEKDARIADLRDQVEFLRASLMPAQLPTYANVHQEANAILNGVNEQILSEQSVSPEVLAERDALLSGTY